MLLIDVPEAERFIKVDPNAPNGFESQNAQHEQNEAANLSEPNAKGVGFESQIDPRAEKLIREFREIRLRLDNEAAA